MSEANRSRDRRRYVGVRKRVRNGQNKFTAFNVRHRYIYIYTFNIKRRKFLSLLFYRMVHPTTPHSPICISILSSTSKASCNNPGFPITQKFELKNFSNKTHGWWVCILGNHPCSCTSRTQVSMVEHCCILIPLVSCFSMILCDAIKSIKPFNKLLCACCQHLAWTLKPYMTSSGPH